MINICKKNQLLGQQPTRYASLQISDTNVKVNDR